MVQAEKQQTGAENIFWDLSVYYDGPDDPRIDEDLAEVATLNDAFAARYRGRVAQLSAEEFLSMNQELEDLGERIGKLFSYASLNFSVYTNEAKWGALLQKIRERYSAIVQKQVFVTLEWNQMEDAAAQAILDNPLLANYRYQMEVDRLSKPYQLSEVEEQLLIEKSVTGSSAWTRLFEQINSAMMLEMDGEQLPMPQVLSLLNDANRETRRKAADAITAILHEKKMELTFIFNVLAADKAADDARRNYPNWITPRNLANRASDEVVNALIETVTNNYDVVARHYDIKRKLLGYDELFDYDRYAPLTLKDSTTHYTWDEARQAVTSAYGEFSEELGAIVERFFAENWIHAPVMEGKRGGAFASYGTAATHPWVFMNFTGTPDSVKTLAHELGHGVHMYLSNEAQTPANRATPLTTAETASVFGEMIVFNNLMEKESDKEVQLTMLTKQIDSMFATVFRQISMNRFEDAMHTARRTEGELSTERLNELWMETQKAMFQDSVTMRDDYAIWWSYVPHFLHTPGYVYAYAFGELLVLALYNLYQEQGPQFVPQYLQLLSDGDSDYPEKLLEKIGVDLNDSSFWQQGIDAISKLIDWEEALARELFPDRF